jgi:cytochrome c biogenesis protein CcmG/thiol:disulfide interchange protein DsbE
MKREGFAMRIRVGIVGIILAAAGAALGSQQAKPAADLKLIDAPGLQKILQQYRGKPVLLNFWATWCEPCRDEYPMLNELAKQYGPQGLQVVGVSMDDDGDVILMRRFLARYKPVFPNFRKKPGDELAFRRSVLPTWAGSLPVTIFYSKDGNQAGSFLGEKPREQYEAEITALLGGSR